MRLRDWLGSMLLVCWLATGLACAEEQEGCSVTATGEGGLQLVSCPDGSVLVVGGETSSACTKVIEANGWGRVVCDDGTSLLLDPDGNLHFPGKGTIEGEARLWGEEEDHRGIEVRVVGTQFVTHTDAQGAYRLAHLPAGIHHLRFSFPGRVPQVQKNIPVIDGAFVADPVELHLGERVAADPDAAVIASPSKETVLVHDLSAGGLLTLIHLHTWDRVVLSRNAVTPSFRFDGREVLWVENLSSRSRVMRHLLDTGETIELEPRGIGAHHLGDGRGVVIQSEVEMRETLAVYDLIDGTLRELGPWLPRPLAELPMSPGGAFVFHGPNQTFLYDHANGNVVLLADERVDLSRVRFGPQGRWVTFTRPQGGSVQLQSYDLGKAQLRVLEPALRSAHGNAVAAPDGSLLWEGREGWRLWDASLDEVIYLGSDSSAQFLPDGTGVVLWVGGFRGASAATLYDREKGTWQLLSPKALSLPEASSDGAHLAVHVDEGEGPVVRIFHRSGGSVTIPEHGWGFLLRTHLGRIDEKQNLVVAEAATGKLEVIFERAAYAMRGNDELLLAQGRQEQGQRQQAAVWDARHRRLHWLGTTGGWASARVTGRQVFYMGCDEVRCDRLTRYDLASERHQLVDTRVMDVSTPTGAQFLLYTIRAEGEDRNGLYLVPLLD